MNFLLTRFSLRFDQHWEGRLVRLDGSGSLFRLDLCARGALDPEAGLEITGLVNIQGIASNRPIIGTLSGEEGGFRVSFRFSDDGLLRNRFEGKIKGKILSGNLKVDEGLFYKQDGDEPWAKVEEASVVVPVSSLRIERRPLRPVISERRQQAERKKPRTLPMRQTAVRLAEALFPAGEVLEAGGEDTIKRLEQIQISGSGAVRRIFSTALFGIEWLCLLTTGKRFSRAAIEERTRWLENPMASASGFKRLLLRPALLLLTPFRLVLLTLLKVSFINTDDAHSRLRTVRRPAGLPRALVGGEVSWGESYAPEPQEPWERQIVKAESFDADEVMEADAVVVGTGAGGGPVAKELAEKGFAVAIIEAGRLYRRQDDPAGAQEMLFTLGNTFVLLPVGKAVGGTTFINSGTCFRTPDEILMRWAGQGMPELHPDRMAPYFDEVEKRIKVAEAEAKYVGPVGEVIRRGSEKLGYHSMNLRRNAFECEGKALCTMGCPHGAKQSTNRSYIPLALKSKASLFTGFKVREILTGGERAIGVHAYGRGRDGRTVRLTVFARAVILAAGTLLTPPLIQRNGLVRGNRWVGRNLTFHPATGSAAIVPGVEMRTHECIPQGYCVDEFQEEGIMFEGANIPLTGWAVLQQGVGKRYMDMLERFPNMANFGYMVEDTSKGVVRPGLGERPLITYWMNQKDLANLVRGMATLGRIFLAAGAEAVYCATLNMFTMTSEDDVRRFEARRWRPRDFFLSAYHPLGTARVGPGPRVSAVSMDHECHAVPGLFVVDGSGVPESIGVNPQVTIMAMSTRAAHRIADLLEKAR